jgi:hypothetical protein
MELRLNKVRKPNPRIVVQLKKTKGIRKRVRANESKWIKLDSKSIMRSRKCSRKRKARRKRGGSCNFRRKRRP